jgi:4-amino-4-deoxy-L-arabinose transferase-like glycosyltransferase
MLNFFKNRENVIVWLIFGIIILTNFFFGYSHLSQYSAVDEPYWTYDRTPDYWNNIKEHDWKGTKINDKPGIMVALISGPGLLFENPLLTKFMRRHVKTDADLALVQKINFAFRLPIYLFCFIGLGLYFFLVKKLLGKFIATVSLIFIGLSPIVLGQSLIINPDSLLWIFLPLSIISYLVYQKNNDRKFLYLAGAMMGFSILTKYVANLLYIFIPAMILIDYFFRTEKTNTAAYFKKATKDFIIFTLISFAIYTLLFPAVWVNLKLLLKGTFFSKPFEKIWPFYFGLFGAAFLDIFLNKSRIISFFIKIVDRLKKINFSRYFGWLTLSIIAFAGMNVYLGMKFYNFQTILASPKSSGDIVKNLVGLPGNFFAGYYALIFGLTPIVSLLFLAAIIFFITDKKPGNNVARKYIFISILFLFFYYLGSSASGVGATVRYQIALYPLTMIAAAIGVSWLFEKIKNKKSYHQYLIYLILFLFSAFSLFMIKPFYLAYSSYLLPNQYVLNLKGMGDGNYEVAQYLNNLPNADKLFIWSDKGGVCESFRGRCIIGQKKSDIEGITFDYFVTSIDRKSKNTKSNSIMKKQFDFDKLYDPNVYDYRVIIGGRINNFVKVVSAEKVKK